jgi:aldehyde dehydrogenase (NAD+)
MLRKLCDVVARNADALIEAAVKEFGGPVTAMVQWMKYAPQGFLAMAEALERFEFTRRIKSAEIVMEPIGVVGMITPWNANVLLVTNKLATAIAAGCTAVVKPSEMSALQTQVLTEALHEAGLPPGVFNIVVGRGDVVGAELSSHPDIAKVSFTGSTVVGKAILRAGVETLKRVTLELGGKSPTVILDDADFKMAVPLAVAAGTMNSGQACVGDEGAKVLTGGEGHPNGLGGYFVRATLFANVTNGMTIAREEIFGPVLCLLTYRTEEEAIAIANDTVYGLQAYVISSNSERARAVAAQIQAGRVSVNGILQELQAPFGGVKHSGIGREFGTFAIEAHLEPKTILTMANS